MAWIPEHDVLDVFELVQATARTQEQKAVVKYFGDTYVAKKRGRRYEQALYPPGTWNLNSTLYTGNPHTNNPAEGYHNKLARLINKEKTTIWDLISTMKKVERKSEIEIARLTANQEFAEEDSYAVSRKARIKEKMDRYNESNRLEILTAIAYILDE